MSPDSVNQKLVDQYTEIARLAGGLAHEIKNPLSTIRLNMELLAEDFRSSEAPRDRRAMRKIDLVQRECQRLLDLLNGFLDFAKVRRLRLEPSDLNVQVMQVLEMAPQSGADQRGAIHLPTLRRNVGGVQELFAIEHDLDGSHCGFSSTIPQRDLFGSRLSLSSVSGSCGATAERRRRREFQSRKRRKCRARV